MKTIIQTGFLGDFPFFFTIKNHHFIICNGWLKEVFISSWQLGLVPHFIICFLDFPQHLAMVNWRNSSHYFDRVAKAKRTLQSSKTRALLHGIGVGGRGVNGLFSTPMYGCFHGGKWWLTMLNSNVWCFFQWGKWCLSIINYSGWNGKGLFSLFLRQSHMGDRCPILPLVLIPRLVAGGSFPSGSGNCPLVW